MNVILIVVDSLRSDNLSISGYSRKTSPNIDKLASSGVYFNNAISVFPSTTPALASIMTGLYPHSHEIRFLYTHKLSPKVTVLQEILKAHGYTTIGNDIEARNTGLERGFNEFNLISWRIKTKIKRNIKKILKPGYKTMPQESLTDFAIKTIDRVKNRKFFLYLHYMGLHWPYAPPAPYDHMFDSDYTGKHTFNEVDGEIKRGDLIFNNNLPAREIEHAIAHYDGAINNVDFHIGRLLNHLKSLELEKNTIIVLTADHGECFGEHNLFLNHGDYLYDEALRVPLIIKCPALPQKKIQSQVQLTDIMPTVLELLKIPAVDKVDGVSLVPLINEDKKVREYAFSETGRPYFNQNKRAYIPGIKGKWRMIRTNKWKLIYIPHPEKDIFELYNIEKDPMEKNNLIEQEPEKADFLKKRLFEWIPKSDLEQSENDDLTQRSIKLLRQAGYIE